MLLGATTLGAVAIGGIAAGMSMAHIELDAAFTITSEVTAGITVSGFSRPVGESVFATYGMVDEPKNLILAANNKRAVLATAIDTAALSLTLVGNISTWTTSGALTLDLIAGSTDTSSEIAYYEGKTGQTITLQARGKDGTTAKAFPAGATVSIRPIAETHNLLARTLIDVEEAVLAHDTELDTVLTVIAGLEEDVAAKLPLTGGTLSGPLILPGAPTIALHAATKAYVDLAAGGSPPYYDAKAYGLAGNGSTDDTAALQALIDMLTPLGGGRIYFPPGKYVFSGPFRDTGQRNAQVLLPIISPLAPPVTIELVGALPPPRQFSWGSPVPSPNAYTVLKSTATGGSGTAAFIAGWEGGGASDYWGHVQLVVRNIVFEAPFNPSFTVFNCFDIMGPTFSHVLIYAGAIDPYLLVEPTHANSVAIKLAPSVHSAGQIVDTVDIWGFYNGLQDGELAENHLNVWSCKIGILVPFTYHLSTYRILGIMGCARGIVAAGPGSGWPAGSNDGTHYMRVLNYAMERGLSGSGTGLPWTDRIYDIDDPSNLLKGDLQWSCILAGVGNDHSFIKNGGTNLHTKEIGTP